MDLFCTLQFAIITKVTLGKNIILDLRNYSVHTTVEIELVHMVYTTSALIYY